MAFTGRLATAARDYTACLQDLYAAEEAWMQAKNDDRMWKRYVDAERISTTAAKIVAAIVVDWLELAEAAHLDDIEMPAEGTEDVPGHEDHVQPCGCYSCTPLGSYSASEAHEESI